MKHSAQILFQSQEHVRKTGQKFGRFLLFLLAGWAGLWVPVAAGEPAPVLEMEMVRIPGGTFTMGSTEAEIEWVARHFFSESLEWYRDETPARQVHLDDYDIDKYEVTVAQYRRFLEKTGRPPSKYLNNPKLNQANQPVIGVTWQEANDYCQWLGKRLPTEAEWEKAARGPEFKRYPWGDLPDESRANTRGKKDNVRYTAPAGNFPQGQSPYGIMDMAGNVWEWTQDWYLPYPGNEYKNEMYGKTLKVIRGGSWNSNMDLARSGLRGKALPDRRQDTIGIRCAREVKSASSGSSPEKP